MPRRSLLYLVVFVPTCILLLLAAPARAQQAAGQGIQTGVFYLVEGLTYQTPTLSGTTNNKGEFQYRPGENVTFSVGGLVLGSAPGDKRLTSAHLVLGVEGDIEKLKYSKATNMARFVQSLDEDGNVENGITVTAQTRDVVTQYNYKIDFTPKEDDFAADPNVVALFGKLNKTLRTAAQARNYVRWTLLGIQMTTDVKIPTRDGLYVLADIFRPIDEGKYPPIVQLGSYGKVFIFRGCNCSQDDVLAHEAALDKYFEGNPDNVSSEVSETTNMWYWIPKGYVSIRIDAPGICNSPGVLNQYSVKETEALYDSIEWAAQQPWSNGNVGTFGSSLFGINQVSVASLQPPHLKAMIDGAGDSDRYRQVVYSGGILNAEARKRWNEHTEVNRCLNQKTFEDTGGDKIAYWLAHPFNEPPWYGTYLDKPPMEMNADMSKVVVPFLSLSPLEHMGMEHVKGGIELFMLAATKPENKQLRVTTGDFNTGYLYATPNQPYFLAFFEHWLKGVNNDVMNEPRVRMMIRTGGGGWFWQNANEYPPANTEYRKYYLDAAPSGWAGDGKRSDFMKLSSTAPSAQASKSYSADVHFEAAQCGVPGVSFISEPLTEDTMLAGFIVLHLWVSSTSSDADIFASVRVMDKNNQEIPYALRPRSGYYPVGKGWQRVSHRALDKDKSTIFRPWTTDRQADYAELKSPSEVVPIDVYVEPTTALVRKGDRIRLDVQPVIGCDWGSPQYWDASYHQGASNTVYTGADHTSYVQLPVVPAQVSSVPTSTASVK